MILWGCFDMVCANGFAQRHPYVSICNHMRQSIIMDQFLLAFSKFSQIAQIAQQRGQFAKFLKTQVKINP